MYQTSEKFNSCILGSSRSFLTKIEINGTEVEAQVRSLVKNEAAISCEYFDIGGTTSAYVEVIMDQPDISLENQEIAVYIGLELGDTNEFVKLGLFTVQKPQCDDGVISFTAYDRMSSKLNRAYFSELTYPVDGKVVLSELAEMSGVPITGLDTLPNGIMIDRRAVITESGVDDNGEAIQTTEYTNPFDGYTYREALGYIAQLYGKFAVINAEGKIELRWYREVDYTIAASKYYDDLVSTEQAFALGSIECVVGSTTLVAGSGTTGLQITNPVMTQEHLDRIYEQLKDFTFLPLSLSFFGDIRLELGDVVKVNDKYGNIIKIPIMRLTQDYDGGLITAVKSCGKTEAESFSNVKGPTAQALDRVYTELFLVKEVIGNKAEFDYVYAVDAEFKKVKADYGEYKKLVTQQFEAEAARIDVISGDLADYKTVVADEFTAVTGRIDTVSGDLADYKVVIAGELDAHTALLEQITANQITTEYLNTYYANINLANIDIANIEKAKIGELFAEMGLISTAVIENGHVTGYLDSVSINANAIRAGTLSVDRLIINGSEESIIYALNNAGELTSTSVDTLDGGILTERTVTADKLVAHSITANEITTSNIIGANGWINLAQGTFNYGNQLIWDGSELYISAETITMVTDGRYATQDDHNDLADRTATLELSADNFAVELASTQKTVSDNYVTLQDYTDAAKASAISTAAADATAKADNALTAAKADATTKANKALSDAKADATTKANQALSDAKADATAKADAALSDAMDALDITNATVAVHAETISDHETRISATEDEISLKVSTKDFSSYQTTVTGQISAAKASAISTAASDATTKANKALSDAKTDATAKADAAKASAVSTAATDATTKANNAKNAAITAAAADATTKANAAQSAAISTAASDATAKANQALIDANAYTTAEITTVNESLSITNQEISVMKGQIALKVEQTDIDTAVTNLQIGGRNVIRNSAFINGLDYWSCYGNTSSVDTDRTFNGHPTIKVCNTGLTENRWYGINNYYLPQNSTSILAGETWTVSCYYYVEDASTIDDYFCLEVNGRKEGATSDSMIGRITGLKSSTTVEGAWTKIEKTFTATKDYSACRVTACISRNGTVWFADFKLEKGNKATDWTPAPEDVDSSISAVDAKFASYSTTSEMESAITVAKSEITSEVSEKYSTKVELETVDGKVTTLEDWQSEASQKITKDGIIATVGNYYAYQSDLDTVENRVTEAETQILQQADEISLRVKKDGIVNAINLSTEEAKIAAARITLAGATIADSFTATNLHVTGNSVFDGTLRATKGTIAGWNINSTSISTTNSSGNYIYLGNGSSANQDVLFVRTGAGTTASPYSWPVIIRGNGYAEFRNAKITGDITANSIKLSEIVSIYRPSISDYATLITQGGDNINLAIAYKTLTTPSIIANGEIISHVNSNSFRAIYGNYGFIIRNDGNGSYFLLTNSGDQYGSFNSLRPLCINNSSGFVTMANGLQVGGALTCLPYENTSYKRPICSTATDGNRVTYAATNVSSGTYYIKIYGQYGTTGTTYAGYVYNSKTSDIRLKHNIRDTDVKALPVINKMRMRAFDWADGTHQDIGYVADELELIDSSFAIGGGYDDDGVITYKSVNDLYVLGYLTKGIQELYSVQVDIDNRLVTVENWKDSVEDQLQDARQEISDLRAELSEAKSEIEQLKLQASAA